MFPLTVKFSIELNFVKTLLIVLYSSNFPIFKWETEVSENAKSCKLSTWSNISNSEKLHFANAFLSIEFNIVLNLTVFNFDASKADSKISKTFFKSIVVIFELRNALLPIFVIVEERLIFFILIPLKASSGISEIVFNISTWLISLNFFNCILIGLANNAFPIKSFWIFNSLNILFLAFFNSSFKVNEFKFKPEKASVEIDDALLVSTFLILSRFFKASYDNDKILSSKVRFSWFHFAFHSSIE